MKNQADMENSRILKNQVEHEKNLRILKNQADMENSQILKKSPAKQMRLTWVENWEMGIESLRKQKMVNEKIK